MPKIPKYKKASGKDDLKPNKPMKSWKSSEKLVVKTKKSDGDIWIHHYTPWWNLYPKKPSSEKDFMSMIEEGEVDPNEPVQSWREDKKLAVLAKKGSKEKVIHFGHADYEDYTMHGDPQRRENYLARSGGIRDSQGKLTKSDKFSANYWSREKLW